MFTSCGSTPVQQLLLYKLLMASLVQLFLATTGFCVSLGAYTESCCTKLMKKTKFLCETLYCAFHDAKPTGYKSEELRENGTRVVKSSRQPARIATNLVTIGRLLCLAFLYGWFFINKISLDWPLTLTTQPCTSKLCDNPEGTTLFEWGKVCNWIKAFHLRVIQNFDYISVNWDGKWVFLQMEQ